MQNIQIIILAAGKATRMGGIAKALAQLKNKPFLKHILDTIDHLHLNTKTIIVVGHKQEEIKEVLGNNYIYAEQKEQLGTGHAVLSAKNAVDPKDKIILVLSADQPLISKNTLENIIGRHIQKSPMITLGTVIVPNFDDYRIGMNHFGRIIRDEKNLVKKIVEFKDANEEERQIKEVNPAIYAFDSKWLWENIHKIKNDNVKGEYYLTDLIKICCEQKQKIEAIPVSNIIEGLQPNTKEELETLEKLTE